DYNLVKYGCSKCHSGSDPFIKKILLEKEALTRSITEFKEGLSNVSLDKKDKKVIYKFRKPMVENIYALQNSFQSMENNLHDSMLRRFAKHQKIEVFIGLISLISILFLLFLLYKKIIKDILLLKRIVKNLEDDKEILDKELTSFNNDDFKLVSETLINSFEKLRSTENQLKRQIEEMESMNEELQSSNQQLEMVTAELEEIKNNLEKKVQEKTIELEEAYKELERSEAIKSSFLQSISHEFKTPLTPLFGYLKLMKNRELGDITPLQEQSLNIMLTCAEKIYNTIDDLILLT
ncbi:MAG: hypothetical protein N2999_08115, partial [Proteobacteria bacterium]|nr:hypothetical protein [Pseudomonadota bacterium]